MPTEPITFSPLPDSPRLLDRVRACLRLANLGRRTETAYVSWIRRYILFHGKRHPATMGRAELEAFLTHLAVARRVGASTQNQALSALLFLYGNDKASGWHLISAQSPACEAFHSPLTRRARKVRRGLSGRVVRRRPLLAG